MSEPKRKLSIGCGKALFPREEGWTNLDIFESVQADVFADMAALPFDRGSFDLIYASHVLEHAHRRCILATLSHWRDILKPGGTLRLAVPNFEACCEWYMKTKDLSSLIGLLYGGQNHPKNSHSITFDWKSLSASLHKVGFENVRHWDWRATDHSGFDDYSQAYLPHLSKDSGGLLVSLNLEADRPL